MLSRLARRYDAAEDAFRWGSHFPFMTSLLLLKQGKAVVCGKECK